MTRKQRALLEFLKPRSDRGIGRSVEGHFHQSTTLSAINAGLVAVADHDTQTHTPATRRCLILTAKGREALGQEGEPFHGRKPEAVKP